MGEPTLFLLDAHHQHHKAGPQHRHLRKVLRTPAAEHEVEQVDIVVRLFAER